ncbi:MAG: DUF3791 domain-containing protein [Spirochaetaceae bacterium]|jgi:hypothetical protein|nr:DUF3791 domain-containing protein [Spirochaetaceae bacterium]
MEWYRRPPKAAFTAFCIETYAREHNISGAGAAEKFEKTGVLDYLFSNYDVLHTQGPRFILPLIDEYMEAAQ